MISRESDMDLRHDQSFLELLAEQYPNRDAACTEIINLSAIMNLPKGTEHFVSDIHGEYEAFDHVMKNASGVIWEYIQELYGSSIRMNEKRQLALTVCYPQQILDKARREEGSISDFYRVTLLRMVRICKRTTSKYTRSKVRKAMPTEFAYILEELIHEDADRLHKHEYYNQIIDRIIDLKRAEDVITALASLILRMAVDHLHVIGDIFDRGPAADKIMDDLCNYHSVDVQWGNHDILWMGAASGSAACICNVIRIAAKYNNLDTLEEGYGINLVPLATFAMDTYNNDPCERFHAKDSHDRESDIVARMHKAIAIIQFKAEAAIIRRNPGFLMDDRLLLDKIDYISGIVDIDGHSHAMLDKLFPTIKADDPYSLTPEEANVMEKLTQSFLKCEKLQRHVRFLFNKGGMYKIHNGNLLYHGCIPMCADGTLKDVEFDGMHLRGKRLLDAIDKACRQGYALRNENNNTGKIRGLDVMWYLWCGADSPLYGKTKMTTFERYFVADKATHKEGKDPYYELRNDRGACLRILDDFGLDLDNAYIINGHVPVEIKKGESPIKADGKLLVIDGGFAKAYQKVTGMAGYTLIYNSQGMGLVSHKPFTSIAEIIGGDGFDFSPRQYINYNPRRIKVADTDKGQTIQSKINSLQLLARAYEEGVIKERV